MGKAGGKKGKGPVKPDYMTAEYFQQSQVRDDDDEEHDSFVRLRA